MKTKKMYVGHSDDHDFEAKMTGLLLFRKIVEVKRLDDQNARLTLDNGVKVYTQGNEGCGGCENGWYYLDKLNGCDNAITNVECVCEGEEVYKIFVFAVDRRIDCIQYSGCDNGYYGTGYDVYIEYLEVDE